MPLPPFVCSTPDRRAAAGPPTVRAPDGRRPALLRALTLAGVVLAACLFLLASGPVGAQEAADPGGSPAVVPTSGQGVSGEEADTAPAAPDARGWEWLLDRFGDRLLTGVRALLAEFARELLRLWEQGLPVYVARALLALVGLVADFLYAQLSRVCCGPLNFITRTPAELTYASPAVLGLWGTLRAVANAALAVVALWGALNLVVREHLGGSYQPAADLFPRLALGALLVNTSRWWAGLAIDLNNALCAVVGLANPFPAWDALPAIDRAAVDAVAFLVYVAVGLLLFLQQLGRLALVDLLVATAPLGVLCWVLPQTQGWARLWGATFSRVVFVQFLQVALLKLGAALLGSWAAALGWPLNDVLSILVGVAVLGLALRVPGLLRAHAGGGAGFVRYLVYRQGAQAVGGAWGAAGRLGESAGPRVVQLALPVAAGPATAGAAAARTVVSGVVRPVGRP
jgi:hypothetical protein